VLDELKSGKSWAAIDGSTLLEGGSAAYISPEFSVQSGDLASSRYVIVSSAGAVGKSAFASHLHSQKNAIVWDLSRVKLGTNSFVGTLARIFGPEQLPNIMQSIGAGETLLVFDALDEAEIHSGREGVDIFVQEVLALCGSEGNPSVIFLGRPDAARRVHDLVSERTSSLCHLKIGYFDRNAAEDFCFSAYRMVRADNPASEAVFRSKLGEIFSSKLSGGESSTGEWAKEDAEFYGYAPVLQAIAAVLAETANLFTFELGQAYSRGEFVSRVMEAILLREQRKFLSNAVSLGLKAQVSGELYGEEDQALRLLKFSSGETGWDLVNATNAEDAVALGEAVRTFLPQHPFVGEKGLFSGPAFRDYCLARSLCSTDADLRMYAEVFLLDMPAIASPVLFDVYLEKGERSVHVEHVDALYSSFSSILGKSNCFVDLYEIDGGISLVLGSDENESELVLKSAGKITLTGSVFNAQVDAHLEVDLIAADLFEIGDSSIDARSVGFICKELGVVGNVGIEAEELRVKASQPLLIKLRNEDSTLAVDFPGAERFPWTSFHVEFGANEDGDEAYLVAHTLGRILRWFRKDRRAEFARYSDLIKKHIVGAGARGQQAFEFLEHIDAVEERGNLYVLRTEPLEKFGVRWAGSTVKPDDRLIRGIQQFLQNA